jgi:hypothetical protein
MEWPEGGVGTDTNIDKLGCGTAKKIQDGIERQGQCTQIRAVRIHNMKNSDTLRQKGFR